MSLMKSLNSGVSGLRAFQTKMDVIGNNISNVDTAGFKSSRVTFSEMLSQQAGSGQGSQSSPQSGAEVGLGVRISAISRDFNQGSLQTTGQQTDLAIEGQGFFMVREGNQSLLTRSGNFAFNRDGYLVDQAGRHVQGYNAEPSGGITSGGATENLRVDFESILPPKATGNVQIGGNLNADASTVRALQTQSSLTTGTGEVAATTTPLNDLAQTQDPLSAGDEIEFTIRLNDGSVQTVTHTYAAGDTVGDLVDTLNTELSGEATAGFLDGILNLRSEQPGSSMLAVDNVEVIGAGSMVLPGFLTTSEGSTGEEIVSTTVYDDLGRAHNLMINFVQSGSGNWDYEVTFLDGQNVTAGQTGSLTFDTSGRLTSGSSAAVAFEPGNGASPVNFEIRFGDGGSGTALSQYAGSSSAKVTSQDGYTEGRLVDFSIDGDGYINGIFSNDQNMQLGQIAVADVPNYDGLETRGNGLYSSTNASGDLTVDTFDKLANTRMAAGMLEGSNVDLAREFTDMITAQRAYQSNARVITTADELLVEAVNLKR